MTTTKPKNFIEIEQLKAEIEQLKALNEQLKAKADTTKTEKIYVIVDKKDATKTYKWNRKIERDNENNPAIIKVSPAFMFEVQKLNDKLVSAELFLKDYCEKNQIVWNDEYLNFKND